MGLDVTDKYLRIDEGFISRLSSRQCKRRTREHGDNSEEMQFIVKSLLSYPLTKFGKFDLPDVFAVAILEDQTSLDSRGEKSMLYRMAYIMDTQDL